MPKPSLLLPAVVFLALGVAAPSLAAPQAGTAPKASKPAGTAPRVKELYKMDCALCHNENGDGKTDLAKGMELTLTDLGDPKTLEGKTDDQLFGPDPQGQGQDAGRGCIPSQERRNQRAHRIHPRVHEESGCADAGIDACARDRGCSH